MHLFRWVRFLSWKRGRRPSTPRRSSRWLMRHFHRSGSSRASLNAPALSTLSASTTFDMAPSMIHIEPQTASDVSEQSRSSRDEDDRKFIEDFHRSTTSDSRALGVMLPRVSSLFHTTGRSSILERASVVNLFNQLQFEMPPAPLEPVLADDPAQDEEEANELISPTGGKKKTRSQRRLAKRKLRKLQRAAEANASASPPTTCGGDSTSSMQFEQVLARTEPSFFRQYMLRAKSKPQDESSKLRPLTSAECQAYLQSVALDTPTRGSRGFESAPDSPIYEPMQFLFFGGCSEENPHRLREIDAEPRRYRARYVATQPTPSSAASIHIKPTLVRGLPSVFEPRFESMYI